MVTWREALDYYISRTQNCNVFPCDHKYIIFEDFSILSVRISDQVTWLIGLALYSPFPHLLALRTTPLVYWCNGTWLSFSDDLEWRKSILADEAIWCDECKTLVPLPEDYVSHSIHCSLYLMKLYKTVAIVNVQALAVSHEEIVPSRVESHELAVLYFNVVVVAEFIMKDVIDSNLINKRGS